MVAHTRTAIGPASAIPRPPKRPSRSKTVTTSPGVVLAPEDCDDENSLATDQALLGSSPGNGASLDDAVVAARDCRTNGFVDGVEDPISVPRGDRRARRRARHHLPGDSLRYPANLS